MEDVVRVLRTANEHHAVFRIHDPIFTQKLSGRSPHLGTVHPDAVSVGSQSHSRKTAASRLAGNVSFLSAEG